MDTIITGRKFSMIEDDDVRKSMVLSEERDMAYEIEVNDIERTYNSIVLNGKTIHGTKL